MSQSVPGHSWQDVIAGTIKRSIYHLWHQSTCTHATVAGFFTIGYLERPRYTEGRGGPVRMDGAHLVWSHWPLLYHYAKVLDRPCGRTRSLISNLSFPRAAPHHWSHPRCWKPQFFGNFELSAPYRSGCFQRWGKAYLWDTRWALKNLIALCRHQNSIMGAFGLWTRLLYPTIRRHKDRFWKREAAWRIAAEDRPQRSALTARDDFVALISQSSLCCQGYQYQYWSTTFLGVKVRQMISIRYRDLSVSFIEDQVLLVHHNKITLD